jgi:hypothetical protein
MARPGRGDGFTCRTNTARRDRQLIESSGPAEPRAQAPATQGSGGEPCAAGRAALLYGAANLLMEQNVPHFPVLQQLSDRCRAVATMQLGKTCSPVTLQQGRAPPVGDAITLAAGSTATHRTRAYVPIQRTIPANDRSRLIGAPFVGALECESRCVTVAGHGRHARSA